MDVRLALLFFFMVGVLGGCVSSHDTDPLKSESGRNEARDAYVRLGLGYLAQGDTASAKAPLGSALAIDPGSADAHAALALVFQREMENSLADEHFRAALAHGGDARILNNYGSFLFEQGRYQEAMARFEQASADTFYSERARVFENLGLTALRLGQADQAEAHFQRALRLDSRQPLALLELSQLSFDAGQYVPAKGYYDAFSQLSGQNARSLLLGIRLAQIHQQPEQAAMLALQLQRLYPGTSEYRQYQSEQR
ncbi:type IV pilus biogenesis/stability protein PilW [Stutzerimonas kirkiae]|uniref:Type IV pilus biogenesis/stability protein PilW n=1 Tax=Stutzerimonas kirkiae TaxID=2211392 RepID=A0A4Q9REF5_9GAMM|nr:type IV pilus biogenesis/stability protein PilW [Stutzerimonas kirkiae]TBU98838.1 type IV pilus biogenesis/stability protein PilW [Stutzerimonas kirkiae]TBV03932.1 type IV pilus biogenesis/stability protein PilW [Stutzerimonas kirkiae]TBV09657.1 type IV pilus biogenesis/stability protein PilW [Stutzerimonas kirkiae]TBV16810.1 type IV pilus biogenesis/stability protein PilW [Stutzerimonas kirkiae]